MKTAAKPAATSERHRDEREQLSVASAQLELPLELLEPLPWPLVARLSSLGSELPPLLVAAVWSPPPAAASVPPVFCCPPVVVGVTAAASRSSSSEIGVVARAQLVVGERVAPVLGDRATPGPGLE